MIGVDIRRDVPIATIVRTDGTSVESIETIQAASYSHLLHSLHQKCVYWQTIYGCPIVMESADIDFLQERSFAGQ